ncbi:hypothetical protein F2Q70_00019423 [Brassica cretica]|uniref:RNase H type-1 domain-containing protein n=1 Tax=Brassica cretica TaxID=69181 RepID=A0A8S9GJ95_BRACR|nr:hypothetical protein F2Q70_00019423 [Brassica cretica]
MLPGTQLQIQQVWHGSYRALIHRYPGKAPSSEGSSDPPPLMAEALAVWSSLHMAASLKIPHFRVCSDSQTLIQAITNRAMTKEIIGVVADINHLSSLFLSISFVFMRIVKRIISSIPPSLISHDLRVSDLRPTLFSFINSKKKKKSK